MSTGVTAAGGGNGHVGGGVCPLSNNIYWGCVLPFLIFLIWGFFFVVFIKKAYRFSNMSLQDILEISVIISEGGVSSSIHLSTNCCYMSIVLVSKNVIRNI